MGIHLVVLLSLIDDSNVIVSLCVGDRVRLHQVPLVNAFVTSQK